MSLNTKHRDVTSSVLPRWKRKALSAMESTPRKQKRSRRVDSSRKTPRKTPQHDRFIPKRSAMDFGDANFKMTRGGSDENCNLFSKSNAAKSYEDHTKEQFQKALKDNMGASASRVLAFKTKAPKPAEGYQNSLKVLYSTNREKRVVKRPRRHIPSAPERILDAPDLIDDYYLNLLDWGAGNIMAVALGRTVYLWNAETGGIDELCQLEGEDDYVSSVKFVNEGGCYLAVGTNYNDVILYDVEQQKQLRKMGGHEARVSSLSWNNHILSSGGRDSAIIHHDVRVSQHHVSTLQGAHTQEVCGLTWSPDGTSLASGGNDNLLCIWDARGGAQSITSSLAPRVQAPRLQLTDHLAAVKALAWCPYQRNVLASGGGTADRTIKFWNTANGSLLNSVDTGSQVCSLVWNPHEKEILSSHGFSENQLCLWKYPTMVRTKELTGHTARVLHMAVSPNGNMVCSAAADETLRFWNVFSSSKSKSSKSGDRSRKNTLSGMHIR